MRTVLVFGTFDGLHPGHRYFLQEARKRGERLVASIARDEFVASFKGRRPVHSEQERLAQVLASGLVDEAYLSDPEPGTYSLIIRFKPDVICIGHDQEELRRNLSAWLAAHCVRVELVTIGALAPERYKSSILFADRSSS